MSEEDCKDQEKDLNIINDINIIKEKKLSATPKIGDYICQHPQHNLELVTKEKCRNCIWCGRLTQIVSGDKE